MTLLLATVACCCALLIGIAVALWRSIRRECGPQAVDGAVEPFADAMLQAAKVEMPGRTHAQALLRRSRGPHPRMDLAAGVAAGSFGAGQQVCTSMRSGMPGDFRSSVRTADAAAAPAFVATGAIAE